MATDPTRTAVSAVSPVASPVASTVASIGPTPRAGLKWKLGLIGTIVGFGAACTGETAVPIDLNSTTVPNVEPSTIPEALDPENPNEDQNRVAVAYAEQQCLEDPELEEGYVRIVVPETEEIVGEITVDCEQVRAAATGSE